MKFNSYKFLNNFSRNLNDLAHNGKIDPIFCRDEEIQRVLQIISRKTKNNAILIGESGVGKTAIVECLAQRIIDGDVPENLKTKQIFSLDMGALIAGAKFRGEFEDRLKSIVKEVISANGEFILFIEDIHTLVGTGAIESTLNAAHILEPALSQGQLHIIGTTNPKDYEQFFETDKVLKRRFEPVIVNELDTKDAISILRIIKEKYETHHQIRITDEAIIAAVELSQRYISGRFLPDKAIDLIDEAASKLRLDINTIPEEQDRIERRIHQLKIERELIKKEKDPDKLKSINERIANLTVYLNKLKAKWQSEIELIEQIQLHKKEIENLKSDAENAQRNNDLRKVAEIRYGYIPEIEKIIVRLRGTLIILQNDAAMVNDKVDTGEIVEVVSRLTGIPPSRILQSDKQKLLSLEIELHKRIVGQDDAIGAVSNTIRRSRAGFHDTQRPIGSFIFMGSTGVGKTELSKALAEILFDKETRIVQNNMSEYQEPQTVSRLIGAHVGHVGYKEGGQLTEAIRRKPYSVIFLDEIEKAHPDVFNILLQVLENGYLTDNQGIRVDFRNTIIIMRSNIGSKIIHENRDNLTERKPDETLDLTRQQMIEQLKKTIPPKFLKRIDEIILFHPLSPDEIQMVIEIQLVNVKKILEKSDIRLTVTKKAILFIATQSFDPQFGAQPIKRVIQKILLNELSKMILEGTVNNVREIVVDEIEGKLTFSNTNRGVAFDNLNRTNEESTTHDKATTFHLDRAIAKQKDPEKERLKHIHSLYHEQFLEYLKQAEQFRQEFGKNIKCDVCGKWEGDLYHHRGQTYCESCKPPELQREHERKIATGKHGASHDFIKK